MTNVLNLIEGSPLDGRNSNSKIDDYKFEAITVDGELEKTILFEASCWEFVCTKVNVYDHEDEGRWETFIGEDKTTLKDAEGDLIVLNGQLVGFKFENTIFFFPHGNCLYQALKQVFREILQEDTLKKPLPLQDKTPYNPFCLHHI